MCLLSYIRRLSFKIYNYIQDFVCNFTKIDFIYSQMYNKVFMHNFTIL